MAIPKFKAGIGRPRGGANTLAHQLAGQSASEDMKAIVENYKAFIAHIKGVSAGILRFAMEPTFRLSGVYCPKDTGKLFESGYLEDVTTPRGASIEIGYAKGGSPHYAILVHENLEARHRQPQSAKFLQRALEEDFGNVQARVIIGYEEASGVKG